jgi:hypothetical protein
MHLAILADLEAQVFLVIKRLASEDGFGAERVGNSSLHREEVEQLYDVNDNVDRQKFGNAREW